MVIDASTERPIRSASAVGWMTLGVEHARVGSSEERITLNHRRGLCVKPRAVGGVGKGEIPNGDFRG